MFENFEAGLWQNYTDSDKKQNKKYSKKKNIAVSFHIIVKALNAAVKIKFLQKWKF